MLRCPRLRITPVEGHRDVLTPANNGARSALADYADFTLRRRWLVTALTASVMLAVSAGGRHVGITNDYFTLFDSDNPQLAALNSFEATYGASNIAMIAVAPKDGTVFTARTLGVIEELTDAAWGLPYSTRVDSLTNHPHSEGRRDELIVGPLVENATDLGSAQLERIRRIALTAPGITGRLASPDGRVGGLVVRFALPEKRDGAVAEITDSIDGILDRLRKGHPDTEFHLTGDVPFNRSFANAASEDLTIRAPAVAVIIVLAAAAMLGSAVGVAAIVAVIAFTVATTIGFAGWIGTTFNPASSGAPIMVATIAVANSVHIVSTTLSGIGMGLDRNAAITESIRVNAWPVFLASLTTAIGFLSLNGSDSPPLRLLGSLVAFGVLCAFVFSMTLLPAVLSLLPLRGRAARSGHQVFFERLGEIVVSNRKTLLWCTSIAAIFPAAGIPRIEFSDSWTTYLSERHQFRRDTDFIIENLTGLETLEYSLNSGGEGGATDPDYLRSVDAFAEWFRAQPEVRHVQAFPDIMKRLNSNMHGDDPAHHEIPDDPELAAQYLLLYELSLPFGSDLNNRIDVDRSATRMTVVLDRMTSTRQLEMDARGLEWVDENAPGLAGAATGINTLFAHLSQRNIRSMLTGTSLAMALISVILMLAFRSLRFGLVSLLPNFIPVALALGLWGYVVGRVGLAGTVVTAAAFGIVVDDTVHFLGNFLRFRRQGLSASDAVRATFRTVGHALLTTTVVLSLGFLVFAMSGFELSWALGSLVTVSLVIALLADFLFLPPLLIATDRRNP